MDVKPKKLLPLSPKVDLENEKHYKVYKSYLDDALSDDHIHNLAVTGKYGSGKSSIVDTYFKKKTNFLKVSFSTFESSSTKVVSQKEIDDSDDTPSSIRGEQSNNLISKGTIFANIINQIIYQVDLKNIPLTRFKIKKPLSRFSKFSLLFEICLLSSLFFPISGMYRIGLSVASILVGLVIIWYFLSNFEFRNLKISIKQVETEINMKRDDLFERYTDEIVYLFEQSGKSILIIEDLDRFKDLSIFEKLRELNTKLNSNLNDKKEWTFIYLIKDELFKDKTDRVKFFDEIIPVIPFITTSNSFDKLREIFKGEDINVRLLRILSQFIDDFRLLLNIHNEYEVYSNIGNLAQNKNDKKIELNELLALIAYKNIFPNQFDDIQNGGGILGDIVKQYKNNVQQQIDNCTKKINDLQEKKNSTSLKNEYEYLFIWASKNNLVSVDNFNNRQYIDTLDKAEYIVKNDGGIYYENSVIEYSKFKNNAKEYANNLVPVTAFDNEMTRFRTNLSNISNTQFFDVDDTLNSFKDNQLLYALIKNKYITLGYLNTINHYYGDSSTQVFMRNLYISARNFDINMKLNDIPGLIEQLQEEDYEQNQILNIELTCWLSNKNFEKFKLILHTADNSEIHFIEELLNYNPALYKSVTSILPNIQFDLSILNPIQVFDIAINNRYADTQSNVELIVHHLNKFISLNEFTSLINGENIYETFKHELIQKADSSITLKKISDVNIDILGLLMRNNRFIVNASNINFYIREYSYNKVFESFINGHRITFDEDLSEETFMSTINENSLSVETFTDIWRTYHGEKLHSQNLSVLDNQLILVLLKLNLIEIDSSLLELICQKEINVKPDFFTHDIKSIILKNQIILNKDLFDKSIEIDDDLNDQIFATNINNLSREEVIKYLKRKKLSNGKFIKIIQKDRGYQNIIFNNEEINLEILSWMKDKEIIDNMNVANGKIKPTFD
ncbi:YobI family P-loop NTPase [Leuconostoc sp. JNUCC 76]